MLYLPVSAESSKTGQINLFIAEVKRVVILGIKDLDKKGGRGKVFGIVELSVS